MGGPTAPFEENMTIGPCQADTALTIVSVLAETECPCNMAV